MTICGHNLNQSKRQYRLKCHRLFSESDAEEQLTICILLLKINSKDYRLMIDRHMRFVLWG